MGAVVRKLQTRAVEVALLEDRLIADTFEIGARGIEISDAELYVLNSE